MKAFQSYDDRQSMCVSKGQFRRVLEVHCLPLTNQQFDALLNKVRVQLTHMALIKIS
jgi:Ca2+-binding EF-hand superfamily protein